MSFVKKKSSSSKSAKSKAGTTLANHKAKYHNKEYDVERRIAHRKAQKSTYSSEPYLSVTVEIIKKLL